MEASTITDSIETIQWRQIAREAWEEVTGQPWDETAAPATTSGRLAQRSSREAGTRATVLRAARLGRLRERD